MPCPVVMLTGHGDESVAVQAMKRALYKTTSSKPNTCTVVTACDAQFERRWLPAVYLAEPENVQRRRGCFQPPYP